MHNIGHLSFHLRSYSKTVNLSDLLGRRTKSPQYVKGNGRMGFDTGTGRTVLFTN